MAAQIIMVQVSDPIWTAKALHLAGALARGSDAQVALVHLIQVQHLSWLGTDMGYSLVRPETRREIHEYELTLEDYGVPYAKYVMQCADLTQGIVQAAEQIEAQIVFAHLPKSFIPYWTKLQWSALRRRLARQNRTLMQADVTLLDSSTTSLRETAELPFPTRP